MSETVFITGADKGLGFSLVKRFLSAGLHVFAGTYTAGESLKELVGQAAEKLTLVSLDVTNMTSVQNAVRTVSASLPALDILINNAGINLEKPVNLLERLDFADQHFQQTMEVNAFGPLRVIQQFFPLLEKGGRKLIINISSEAGSIAACNRTREYAYCMSKSALNMASMILQNDLRGRGFKVLAIHPGWMRTDMGGQNADIHPDESAEGVFRLAMRPWKAEDAIYLDYRGTVLPW
jgi:NAD(P)-dependent dehydrogenase (short-subunit alcohol dehydrogenase family)